MALEGKALTWYQWEDGRQPFYTWDELKIHLLQCFRSAQEEALNKGFLSIQQGRAVADFKHQSAVIASPWKNISDLLLEGDFITGLRSNSEHGQGNSSTVLSTQTIVDSYQQIDFRKPELDIPRSEFKTIKFEAPISVLPRSVVLVSSNQQTNFRKELSFKKLSDSKVQAKEK